MGKAIYTKAEREQQERRTATGSKAGPKGEFHPLATIFPLMKGPAFDALAASIEADGQLEPIVMLNGQILDGRNRWRACERLKAKPVTREFGSKESDGDDPQAYVINENVHRRHLNETQRAVIASKLATGTHGGDRRSDQAANWPVVSQEQAANMLGVGERSVRRAHVALDESLPLEWREFVSDGELPISRAATYAERPDLPELVKRANLAAAVEAGNDPKEAKKAFREALTRLLEGEAADPNAEASPAQTSGRGKPLWLMRALVRHYSRLGQLVCDPFAGWCSTLVAARAEGRRAIGSELDEVLAKKAADPDLRVGDWRAALADIESVDAVICDPPYSARTHSAATTRRDESEARGLTPTYEGWTADDVRGFVKAWSPRCRGWMVALTDSVLAPVWEEAYREAGRYAFAPVPCVIRGMSVRISGDGPSSWAIYAMVARPATAEFVKWNTLPGAYVGTKSRELWSPEVVDGD